MRVRRRRDRAATLGDDHVGTLGAAAASGVRWGLIANVAEHLARVGFTFLVARLIGPDDYGIASQATIYVIFTALLLDQGFGAALIQKPKIEPLDVGSVVWLNVATSLALGGITLAIAPFIGDLFDSPELPAVLRVLTVSVLLRGFAVAPLAVLNRQMGFRAMAGIETTGVLLGGALGVGAAIAGAGYWSLVVQTITIDACRLVGLLVVTGVPPLMGSLTRLRSMWAFSGSLMGFQILLYAERNIDNILVASVLGARQLAFYALGYGFMSIPLMTFGQLINRVMFPIFSRFQHDRQRMQEWLLISTQTMALTGWPLMLLMVLASPDAVRIVFGGEWQPAIAPMQLLCLAGIRQLVLRLVGPVFLALGETRLLLRWEVAHVAVYTAGFVIGLSWGITGLAASYVVTNLLLAPFMINVVGRMIDMPNRRYYAGLVGPAVACGGLVASWVAAHAALDRAALPVLVVVAGSTVAGVGVFGLILRLGWRPLLDDVVVVLRRIAARESDSALVTPFA